MPKKEKGHARALSVDEFGTIFGPASGQVLRLVGKREDLSVAILEFLRKRTTSNIRKKLAPTAKWDEDRATRFLRKLARSLRENPA